MVSGIFGRLTGIGLALLALAPTATFAQDIRVTLLGTGAPPPTLHRFGPGTLIEAGGQKILIDAGRGVLQRLGQANVRWQDVDAVFFTHLHSDHVVGFPDLWLTGWLVAPGRHRALHVHGPQGTKNMVSHLRQAYEFDIRNRLEDDRASPDGHVVIAEDVAEGVVFHKDGLKITAFEVEHGPVKPAFGYRVDFGGRSVVVSGDTRASENLVRHAQRVDLLVHEVASPETFRRAGVPAERARTVIGHHATAQQAAEVFARTKPRLAVYSHIVLPIATEQDLIPPTARTYPGPVELGEDLMVIEVGQTVEVRRPAGRMCQDERPASRPVRSGARADEHAD